MNFCKCLICVFLNVLEMTETPSRALCSKRSNNPLYLVNKANVFCWIISLLCIKCPLINIIVQYEAPSSVSVVVHIDNH